MNTGVMGPDKVLQFWFDTLKPSQWWRKDANLDQRINDEFGSLLLAARHCELSHWRNESQGRLAEIIVLDQFSRHIHRRSAAAFASDAMALVLSQEAIRVKADQQLTVSHRRFLYMPFMHSESKIIHNQALVIFTKLADQASLDSEIRHKNIIDKFGRYPHRNKIMGRQSSEQELAFLNEPGSSF